MSSLIVDPMFILFLVLVVAMFYWLRFCIRKIYKQHKEGKMNSSYNLSMVLGVILVIFGLYFYFDTRSFISVASSINGKVIAINKEQMPLIEHSKESCFRPVYSYFDPVSQKEKVIKSKVCASHVRLNVNDKVELLINPQKPDSDPIENDDFALYGGFEVLSWLGVIFFGLGALGKFLYRRTSKKDIL